MLQFHTDWRHASGATSGDPGTRSTLGIIHVSLVGDPKQAPEHSFVAADGICDRAAEGGDLGSDNSAIHTHHWSSGGEY
jgi:hypothetical protein